LGQVLATHPLQDTDKFEREYAAFFEPVAAPTPARATASAKNQTTVEGEEEEDGFTAVGKGGKSVQYTSESIFKVLAQVNENRGKKACPCSPHSPEWSVDVPLEH